VEEALKRSNPKMGDLCKIKIRAVDLSENEELDGKHCLLINKADSDDYNFACLVNNDISYFYTDELTIVSERVK